MHLPILQKKVVCSFYTLMFDSTQRIQLIVKLIRIHFKDQLSILYFDLRNNGLLFIHFAYFNSIYSILSRYNYYKY